MSDFESAVNFVLKNEKGMENNPKDRGSITNFGISLRFIRFLTTSRLRDYDIFEAPTDQTIRELTVEKAKKIYKGEFWENSRFSEIKNQEHCNYIFDMAVNCGISPAIKCVQRACWAVMKKWELLPDDGILGEKTIKAVEQCGIFIMPALRAERGNYYRDVIKLHPEQLENLKGWYNRTYHVG